MRLPLMIGTPGIEIDKAEEERLKRIQPQSVILFTRNYQSVNQVKELIAAIKSLLGETTLVALDHEGGRVVRFKEALPYFPSPREMAAEKKPETVFNYALEAATALAEWGINLNLAPVVDVFGPQTHERMYSRTFGNDTSIVSEMAVAFIRAMHQGGVKCCAKHFPGSQFANLDPHYDLPTVTVEEKVQDTQLEPFKAAIAAGVDSVMISHMIYLCYDKKNQATLSEKIIKNILRQKLGFKGLVLSDDLEMGAIAKQVSMAESVKRSLQAGCDIVLSCNHVEMQEEAYQGLQAMTR